VPYTPDANDIAFWLGHGMATAEQFETNLRDSFDVLYAESERYPRMMSIELHCRVIGRPGRSPSLDRFINYELCKAVRRRLVRHARRDRPLVAWGARRKRSAMRSLIATWERLGSRQSGHSVQAVEGRQPCDLGRTACALRAQPYGYSESCVENGDDAGFGRGDHLRR
jgi:hypothetical protein